MMKMDIVFYIIKFLLIAYFISPLEGCAPRVYTSLISWKEAQDECRAQGMTLYRVNSRAEQELVVDAVKAHNSLLINVWIGGHSLDAQDQNQWKWTDGDVISWSDWNTQLHITQPHMTGEACLSILLLTPFKWHDWYCDITQMVFGYVCGCCQTECSSTTKTINIVSSVIYTNQSSLCPTLGDNAPISGDVLLDSDDMTCISGSDVAPKDKWIIKLEMGQSYSALNISITGRHLPCNHDHIMMVYQNSNDTSSPQKNCLRQRKFHTCHTDFATPNKEMCIYTCDNLIAFNYVYIEINHPVWSSFSNTTMICDVSFM